MYEKPARIGNICYRFFTLASLIMTVYFFFMDGGAGMLQRTLYAIWMAVCVFGSIKVISDIIGGPSRRRHNYISMMEQLVETQGKTPGQAVRFFLLLTVGTAVAKLIVPVLLLVF